MLSIIIISINRMPVISYEVIPYGVISYDLFSNLVRLIKFNLFHKYKVLIRIYVIQYYIEYMISIYNKLLYIMIIIIV